MREPSRRTRTWNELCISKETQGYLRTIDSGYENRRSVYSEHVEAETDKIFDLEQERLIHEEEDSDPTHGGRGGAGSSTQRNFDAEAEIVLSQTVQSFAKLSSRGSIHEGES